jgi:Uma2 family endonuclease
MIRKPLVAEGEPVPYRFTVKEWHRLGKAGLFDEHDRVELLDGEIILMSPIGSRHAAALYNLIDVFGEQNRRRYLVGAGNPVEADSLSEPLPDLMLVPRSQKNARRHPVTRDTHLVVEIADSSLAYDRGRKLRKYASTGLTEYWIVNLKRDVVEVYRNPKGDEFLDKAIAKIGDRISPQAFPDVVIEVGEIIPPR